jgi:hypothetical protein
LMHDGFGVWCAVCEEAHRHRRHTSAAHCTTKAQARRTVIANLNRAAPWLARVVGTMQRPPHRQPSARLRVARSWSMRSSSTRNFGAYRRAWHGVMVSDLGRKETLPQRSFCPRSLREILYRPSPSLIKSRASDISIRARTRSGAQALRGQTRYQDLSDDR